jgi:hypothetical protein
MINAILLSSLLSLHGGESKLMNGLKNFLPNFAEWGWVTSAVNIYMQTSSLIRTFNTSVEKFNLAMDQLAMAKESAESIWGSMERLKDVSLYDMDSWVMGLNAVNYGIIENGMQNSMLLLEYSSYNFIEGSLGGYLNAANSLDYDAKYAGVEYAFNAYYTNANWNKYKELNPVSPDVEQRMHSNAAARNEIARLRDYSCTDVMTEDECKEAIRLNSIKIDELEASIKENNQQIDKLTDGVPVGRLLETQQAKMSQSLRDIMARVHLSTGQYQHRLSYIQKSSANVAALVRKLLTGRTSSAAVPPKPPTPTDIEPPNIEELCSHEENLVTPGLKGEPVSCIYAQKKGADGKWIADANSAPIPKTNYEPEDNSPDESDEKPRNASVEDFAVLKAMIAYLNLEQEELLLDMEMENALLAMHLALKKGRDKSTSPMLLSGVQEATGMAIMVGDVNALPKDVINLIVNRNTVNHQPWSAE